MSFLLAPKRACPAMPFGVPRRPLRANGQAYFARRLIYAKFGSGVGLMESNQRYYARRASEELRAATRALTPEGKARRRALAEAFEGKARLCEASRIPSFEAAICD
jgi:hypothetical protein